MTTVGPRVLSTETRRRAGVRLWLGLFAVAFGTNVPTPLLLTYRDQLDLSATTLAALFGVYAVGLVPALLLAGPASDRLGRRRAVLPFVVLSAVASVVLMGAFRLAGCAVRGAVAPGRGLGGRVQRGQCVAGRDRRGPRRRIAPGRRPR